jgi:predicted secreted hydrolase/threonine/homoserine/homoserine lactone efflux protein
MNELWVFWQGLLIGLAIAAPVGPIGVLCIRRTLTQGGRMGFLTGLGAATADALYGSVAGFGLAFVSGFLVEQGLWLRLAGGLFLLYLGVKTMLRRPVELEIKRDAKGYVGAYLSTFFLTLTNPMTILSFTAVFAGLGIGSRVGGGYREAGWIVLGVFLGSASWWLILSGSVNFLRKKMDQQKLTWVNRISGVVITAFGLIALLGIFSTPEQPISQIETGGLASSAQAATEGFTRADGTRSLTFPEDFGAHPDFQTEWWYYTGNISDEDGNRFGYQLTFFRRALVAPSEQVERQSAWGTTQAYLAHFAITDAQGEEHTAFERLSRGAAGLAGAEAEPFRVWLDDWAVEETAQGSYHLYARESLNGQPLALDLWMQDIKGPVLQGKAGYSQKGPEPGNASYYFSQTRLVSEGTLQIGGKAFAVQGTSWKDHEFSTSALSEGQVGWDWFSIQLDDHSELMVFQIRRAEGSIDPFSSGTWIASDGATRRLAKDDFEILTSDTWKSPHTGGVYPQHWTVRVADLDLELEIQPVISDQELDFTYQYWEGAVDVKGIFAGSPVTGVGYVELTGYAGTMAGEF